MSPATATHPDKTSDVVESNAHSTFSILRLVLNSVWDVLCAVINTIELFLALCVDINLQNVGNTLRIHRPEFRKNSV